MDNVRELFPQKQLVTATDLETFRISLLDSIKQLITENKEGSFQWIKSYQVRKLLGVSAGTLQTLRNNGTLSFTKIGNIIYYNVDNINKLLECRKAARTGLWGSGEATNRSTRNHLLQDLIALSNLSCRKFAVTI